MLGSSNIKSTKANNLTGSEDRPERPDIVNYIYRTVCQPIIKEIWIKGE